MSKVTKAISDADKCIELRPTWEKGYFRKGSALESMSDLEGALAVYREGAKSSGSKELAAKVDMVEAKVKKAARDKKPAAK